MLKKMLQTGLVGAVLAGGTLMAFPGVATAAPTPRFLKAQTALESQLSNRMTQLTRLSDDVKAATVLTTAHAGVLNTNIAAASTSITALSIKVPTDMTFKELNTDRATMLQDNRVYAVLTPQVFLTIESDTIAGQVTTFQGNEATLQTSVNALVGQPGYQNAMNHFVSFVKLVNAANSVSVNVAVRVLAQTPADYPGDTHVFVNSNHALLDADIDLAHATYDETIIGLASGGYTGS